MRYVLSIKCTVSLANLLVQVLEIYKVNCKQTAIVYVLIKVKVWPTVFTDMNVDTRVDEQILVRLVTCLT